MLEIIEMITDPEIRDQAIKVVPFHGYLSTGAMVGIQMLNIARRMLDAKEGERLFVTCETFNCLPDPFQILAGCTIGNKGLRIEDRGKMAVTVTKRSPEGSRIKGVRITLDPSKTARYPRLHSWYMNTEKVPHEETVPILLKVGDDVYSSEFVDIVVPKKPPKRIIICQKCSESFVQKGDEVLCSGCTDHS